MFLVLAKISAPLKRAAVPKSGRGGGAQRLELREGSVRDAAMTSVLPYSPCGSFPSESCTVSIQEPPGTVDKSANDISGARIEAAQGCFFGIVKSLLGDLAVAVFNPAPVLIVMNSVRIHCGCK